MYDLDDISIYHDTLKQQNNVKCPMIDGLNVHRSKLLPLLCHEHGIHGLSIYWINQENSC